MRERAALAPQLWVGPGHPASRGGGAGVGARRGARGSPPPAAAAGPGGRRRWGGRPADGEKNGRAGAGPGGGGAEAARQPAPGGLEARLAPRLRMALPGGLGRTREGEEGRRGAAAGSWLVPSRPRRCEERFRGGARVAGCGAPRPPRGCGYPGAPRRAAGGGGAAGPGAVRVCERRSWGRERRDASEPFARRAWSLDGEPGPTAAVRARVAVCSCWEEGAAVPGEGAGSCSGSCASVACRNGPAWSPAARWRAAGAVRSTVLKAARGGMRGESAAPVLKARAGVLLPDIIEVKASMRCLPAKRSLRTCTASCYLPWVIILC